MSKYISLGTMSGTSMDGIDLSIMNSDGETNTSIIDNFFFEYSSDFKKELINIRNCLLYTSPSPRDGLLSRMPSSA